MSAPPQLRALCDNLTTVPGSGFDLVFDVCVQKSKGKTPPANLVDELTQTLSACGLIGEQADFLKACAFLVKQASNINAAKLGPRLKPLGFTDDLLAALENAVHPKNAPPEPAAPKQAAPKQAASTALPVAAAGNGPPDEEVDAEVGHTEKEIEQMARDMMGDDSDEDFDAGAISDASSVYSDDGSIGSDVDIDLIAQFRSQGRGDGGDYSGTSDSESDYDSDEDEDSESDVEDVEAEIEDEMDQSAHATAVANGQDKEDEPAAESVESGPADGTPEPEPQVETKAKDMISRLPLDDTLFIIRSLQTHLSGGNLSKDEIVEIGKIAKRSKLSFRALQRLLRLLKTVVQQVLEGDITVVDDSASQNPSGIDTSEAKIEFTDEVKEEQLTQKLRQVVPTMAPEAKDFLVNVALGLLRQDQSIAKSDSADNAVIGDDGVTIRDWLLVEIDKAVWQKRWFVLGPGKLEMFYSPEATSDDDRIYLMPLSVIRIVAQPKTVRPEAPYAFRISVKDVKQVIGDEVRKLILDPETATKKAQWMDIFLGAKMEDADRAGYLGQEMVNPKMNKWTRFEKRWVVVDSGRVEVYKSASHATEGKFLTIIPLQYCTILDDPKTKRKDAPNAFRINVTPNNDTIGAKLRKIVLNPGDVDNKEEWLQSFALCSLSGMPDDMKELTQPDTDSDEEPPPPVIEMHEVETYDDFGRRKGEIGFGTGSAEAVDYSDSPFDAIGRPKGDPDFGKPAGVDSKKKKRPANATADGADASESGAEVDEDDAAGEEDEGSLGTAAAGGKTLNLGEELMAGSLGGEITGKGKKFKSQTRRWFVLTEKCLAIYKDEQSTDDWLSLVPLGLCAVRERPKSKRKKEPHAFRVDISNSMQVKGSPISKMILDPGELESRESWLSTLSVAQEVPGGKAALASIALTLLDPPASAVKQAAVDSVQESDALEILMGGDGEAEDEREVVLRLTTCGLAIVDATNTSTVHAYYPHDSIKSLQESTTTTTSGEAKTANVVVRATRVSNAEKELVFTMKEPKTFIDAAQAMGSKSVSTDTVCSDVAVTAYLEANPAETYLYSKMVAEFKRGPMHQMSTMAQGKKLKVPVWESQFITVNEAILSWYQTEGDVKDKANYKIKGLGGNIRIADITDVSWPAACDPAVKKRARCFQVACGDTLHMFAASKGAEALAWVQCLQLLRRYVR